MFTWGEMQSQKSADVYFSKGHIRMKRAYPEAEKSAIGLRDELPG